MGMGVDGGCWFGQEQQLNMSSKVSCHQSNPAISALISQMSLRHSERDSLLCQRVQEERKVCHSSSVKSKRSAVIQSRPYFNHRTKEGELIDAQFKPIPYVFIPAYKNDTFIAPNRVFEKGKAGKRFLIKMKDTSIFSFRAEEPAPVSAALRKEEKEKTIISRQNEQYNRVIEQSDGRTRAQANKWFLKTRRRFDPIHASELFSDFQPMLSPKDPEMKQTRKISLSKTFDFRNKWRPATRGPETFSATFGPTPVQSPTPHSQSYARSVR